MAIAFGKKCKCLYDIVLGIFSMEATCRLDGGNMSPFVVESWWNLAAAQSLPDPFLPSDLHADGSQATDTTE